MKGLAESKFLATLGMTSVEMSSRLSRRSVFAKAEAKRGSSVFGERVAIHERVQ